MKKNYITPAFNAHHVGLCELVCTSPGIIKMDDSEEANEYDGLVHKDVFSNTSIWDEEW